MSLNEQEAREFLELQYGRSPEWRIEEFDLKVLIPVSNQETREGALEMIIDALDEAQWDIKTFSIEKDGRVECAWCNNIATGLATSAGGGRHPSCGVEDHGFGWVRS